MKSAIYIEDGLVQLVITPETEFEKKSLVPFSEGKLEAKIHNGTFYDCRGGWVRQSALKEEYPGSLCHKKDEDSSIILTIREERQNNDNE